MSVRPTVWQWRWMMKDVLFDVTSNFGSSSADGMRHATISRSRSFNPSVLGHILPSYRAQALSFNKVTVERRALFECVTQQPRTLIYAKFTPFLAGFFVSVSRPRPLPYQTLLQICLHLIQSGPLNGLRLRLPPRSPSLPLSLGGSFDEGSLN